MLVTVLYQDQDESQLKYFCEHNSIDPHIIRYGQTIPSSWPFIDDQFVQLLFFLKKLDLDEEITFVDWSNVAIGAYKDHLAILSDTNFDVRVCQTNILAENYRLPPYMENLIMVSNSILGKDRSRYLFENNPKVFIPKILSGNRKSLINLLETFLEIRSSLSSSSLGAALIIFNSICRPKNS